MKRDSDYWDIRLSWASTMFFIGSAANAAIKLVFSLSSSFSSLLSIITGLVILSSYALCFKELLRRSSNLFWKSVIVFIFVYVFSSIIITIHGEPLDQMIKGTAFLTFAWWIPTGVVACSVKDKFTLYNVWVKASFIISIFALIIFAYHRPDEESTGGYEYNMFFGNCIILPLLIQMDYFTKNKKLWILLLVLLEAGAMILFAHRGVILSLVFFIIYKIAFESKSVVKRVLGFIFIVFSFFILTSSLQSLAEYSIKVLDLFGLQSRTLDILAEGAIIETSGRDEIWKVCIDMIKEHPIFGWGLGGEYYQIGHRWDGANIADVTATAYHPHNGILQNIVCFGIPLGLLVSLFLLYPLLHLNKPKDKNIHTLLVIFAAASVVPMCVSSANFFTTPGVAIYLYLFYRNRRRNKDSVHITSIKQ